MILLRELVMRSPWDSCQTGVRAPHLAPAEEPRFYWALGKEPMEPGGP